MPQPLSRVRSRAIVAFANVGDYPLLRHRKLALLLAESIASWSNVESFMLNLFIKLMGGPTERAATVFLALEGRSSKSSAINAVAKSVLDADRYSLLQALLAVSRSAEADRNRIAHGIWGDSRQIDNALLCISQKDLMSTPLDYDNIFVYREDDFTRLIRQNERLAEFGLEFLFILERHPSNEGGALYDKLCSEPEIAEKLHRQVSPTQSQP